MRGALLLLALAAALPAAAQTTPLLWRVDDADSRVWLLGSVHALTVADSVLHPATEAAYAAAQVVAFEVDPATMAAEAQRLFPRVAADGRPLREVLPERVYAALGARLATLGMAPADVDGLRPWVIAMMLAEAATAGTGLSAAWGVDLRLHARTRADGKETAALETVADQFAALAAGSDAEHVAALAEALDGYDRLAAEAHALVDAWRAGDAGALVRAVKGREGASALKRVLTRRNRAWVAPVEALLAREGADVLVVVGAAHLVGPDSLVALLAARGHDVVRVE